MRHIVILIAALAAALAGACAPEVPDEPTWTEDVRPIVVANCTRCHSPPPLEGAPSAIRFDKYEDEDRDLNGTPDVYGASSEAAIMGMRVQAEEMPPDFPLWPRQQDVIAAWAEAGAPKGPPLDGNHRPDFDVTSEFEQDGDFLVASYSIQDRDFDLVTGRMIAQPLAGGDPIPVTFELFSGIGTIRWDISDVEPGGYRLAIDIDDGSVVFSDEVATVNVP
jgi:hypothetical protein